MTIPSVPTRLPTPSQRSTGTNHAPPPPSHRRGAHGAGRDPGHPGLSAGAAPGVDKPTIVIGSTNFEEQAIVANIWADVLKKAGYQVKVEPALGTRAIVVPAIEKGQIDLEADYAGSLLDFLNSGTSSRRRQHQPRPSRPT